MASILVVEDDPHNRELLVHWLQLKGYTVVIAIDGIEGLMRARTVQPDLILMDIGLPKLDGWQTIQRLKASAATRAIPIIALTAYALSEDRARSIAVGCADYETKPIDFAQLAAKITYWLGGTRTSDGTAPLLG